MYGDHHYGKRDSNISITSSTQPDATQSPVSAAPTETSSILSDRNKIIRSTSNGKMSQDNNVDGMKMASRTNSVERDKSPLSPTPSIRERSNSDTANSHFPLNDLNYESDPAAVAQELSNLQALRRMSMDVNAAGDPDLPSFGSNFGIPNTAPTAASDEDDKARLFWVPARIHPELAPTEFKTFLDNRVNSIKRRSEDRSLSPDSLQHEGSTGGLKRKKSMLSRQIDNSGGKGAEGYTDGAERLDRQRSLSGTDAPKTGISNLQDLEVLVSDPENVMQRLSIETTTSTLNGEEAADDMPILPAAPGNSLRRSTRTTYRRGSLRKGERVPFSKRAAKSAETDGEEPLTSSTVPSNDTILPLSRVQTEPLPSTERVTENFSRPGRPRRVVPNKPSAEPSQDAPTPQPISSLRETPREIPAPKHFVSQIASNGRSSLSPQLLAKTVPQILETPPPTDATRPISKHSHLPERISSHEPPPPTISSQASLPSGQPLGRGPIWASQPRQNQNDQTNQTLKDMAAHPSPLPGNSTRTDSLSFIPTLTEDKKVDNKGLKKEKKEKDGIEGPRKSSWSWGSLLGSEEKEKERKRDEDAKKARSKLGKSPDKSHDNTRLDLLQTTMEGSRGRESLVLDRGDLKLEEERKKESSRKSSGGDGKKEKDSSLFSSLFGGKKRNERDSGGKKHITRNLSPEPPARLLKPDIDYNWTRFSILEERAIYRMAHIKLANPRRALHSQVLLSNFMYSYLAKVQQMHPQIQIPQSIAQKQQQQQQQQQQKKSDQPEEFYQYQKYQEVRQDLSTLL